jgi:hypothetical protein
MAGIVNEGVFTNKRKAYRASLVNLEIIVLTGGFPPALYESTARKFYSGIKFMVKNRFTAGQLRTAHKFVYRKLPLNLQVTPFLIVEES